MKKVFLLIITIVIGFGIYFLFFKPSKDSNGPKQQALKGSKHSFAFNQSMDSLLAAYFQLKDAFVEADSDRAKLACGKMIILADSLHLDELKKDTNGIYQTASMQLNDIKANAESLVKQTNLTEMRQDFRMVSESVYPLLKTIHYEGEILYWQNCPMAFGEGKEANWISNTEQIVNPYLGKKHPDYKATMLHCGEIKDSIRPN